MAELVGLYKIKLSQTRYEKGHFYLSIVWDGGQVIALDGRFIRDNDAEFTLTRNGFRIPAEKLDDFKRALENDLRELNDLVLFENNSFRFHVRYINDKYGEGIDFRKYRLTDRYTGWDRSGIRMKLENVIAIRDWLADFSPREVNLAENIFAGKNFDQGTHDGSRNVGAADSVISPSIQEILDY